MEFLGFSIVETVQWLLPGFVAAWVFYGLTSHPRKDAFERGVQALVFTAFIQVGMMLIRESAFALYRATTWSIGTWTSDKELGLNLLLGLGMGLLMSACAKHNWPHSRLSFFTNRTTSPSEWQRTLSNEMRWFVLHLKENRRLFGWAVEFPDEPTSGHFVIQDPEWIRPDNVKVPCHQVHLMMLPATEVERIEFLKWPHEIVQPFEQLVAEANMTIEPYEDAESEKDANRTETTQEQRHGRQAEQRVNTSVADGRKPGQSTGSLVTSTTSAPATTSKEVSNNGDRKV